MTKQEFVDTLKEADLSKKEFAGKLDIGYSSVNNWGNIRQPVPYWVETWLKNYIKAKNFDDAKKIFCTDKNS